MEVWKPIEDYPDYMVSNLGRVKSLRFGKEKILKPDKTKNEYIRIRLYKDREYKHFFIHRLVAEAFLPNTDNKPFIDHINTIKSDNRVDNLRWVTNKENSNNPLTINKWKSVNNYKAKPILQFDKNMNFIKKWDCAMDIKRELGFNQGNISSCCRYERKIAYGYIWVFESEYELVPFKVFDLKIYRKKVA